MRLTSHLSHQKKRIREDDSDDDSDDDCDGGNVDDDVDDDDDDDGYDNSDGAGDGGKRKPIRKPVRKRSFAEPSSSLSDIEPMDVDDNDDDYVETMHRHAHAEFVAAQEEEDVRQATRRSLRHQRGRESPLRGG